jgi:hypothetical protein
MWQEVVVAYFKVLSRYLPEETEEKHDIVCVPGLETRKYGCRDVTLTSWHPLSVKGGTNFTDKRRSLGRYSSLADSGHGVKCVCVPAEVRTRHVPNTLSTKFRD